jgi:hypothetical protein
MRAGREKIASGEPDAQGSPRRMILQSEYADVVAQHTNPDGTHKPT